jgi:hypothetical protein
MHYQALPPDHQSVIGQKSQDAITVQAVPHLLTVCAAT